MLNKIAKIIPETSFKNRLRCLYWNNFKKNNFKIYFKKKLWKIKCKIGEFKFYENPYPYFLDVEYYFRHCKLKKGDNVIDAGAYPGDFAMYAAKIIENGKVMAFEPDRVNYEKMLANIRLNKIENIIPIEKALYSREGVIGFLDRHTENSSINKNGETKVKITTLDKELKRLKMKKIDFIKIDVEGAEFEAIKGCRKTIKNNPLLELAIASYHIVNGEKSRFKLEKVLKKMGLKTFTLGPPHTTTFAFKNR